MTVHLGKLVAQGRQAEVFEYGAGRVVKLFRSQQLGQLAAEEARKTALVHATGYPAPEILGVVEIEGRQGIVMERLDGPTLTERVLSTPTDSVGLGTAFADLQLRLADLPGVGLPPLEARLEASIERAPLPPAQRESARRCLHECPRGDRVFHGDFHPMNVLSTARGYVVIDWFGASQAHPAADVAQSYLTIGTATLAEVPEGPRQQLLALRSELQRVHLGRYFARSPVTRADVRRWMRPLAAAYLYTQRDEPIARDKALLAAVATGETALL